MKNVALFVFGVVGNASALFLLLAPLITFKRIIRRRSTEQFSGIPYVMALLNCLLSAMYGTTFVSPNNLLALAISGAGAIIESFYVVIFLLFSPKKEKARIFGLLLLVLSIFSTVASVSLFALREGRDRKILYGIFATVFSVVMYGSPLTIIRLVIVTKSVEYMPFFLSLFGFSCGTSWFVFGLIAKDPFVIIPNGLGCGLGTVQLILYAIYRNNKGDSKRLQSEESTEIENNMKSVESHQENQSKSIDHQPLCEQV